MLFLALAIFGSVFNAAFVKWCESRKIDTVGVIASNYLSASLVGWAFVGWDGWPGLSVETVGLGIGGGLLWPGAFLMLRWGIQRYGLSLSLSASRLSLGIPVTFGVFFLDEPLTQWIVVGLGCTLLALWGLRPTSNPSIIGLDWRALGYFPVLMVTMGTVSLWTNLFNTWGPKPEHFLYVTLVFSFSLVFSLLTLAVWKRPVPLSSFLWGQLLGLTNFMVIGGLLGALRSELFIGHSAVAYTLHSVSVVLLGTLVGVGIWRERMSRRNWVGIGFAVAAVVVLNFR
ncbi:MAG: hypothetical protein VX610_05100 [SAR324 cluster bacterium]|nr:hypothetical protein [SAR324 cluster bacterium]